MDENKCCIDTVKLDDDTFFIIKSMNYTKMIPLYIAEGLEIDPNKTNLENLVTCLEIESDNDILIGGTTLIYNENEYVLKAIAIQKKWQRKNFGSILVNIVCNLVRNLGGKRLLLNAKAPEFYKKLGFKIIPRDIAPNISDCLNCPHYNICKPEIMEFIL